MASPTSAPILPAHIDETVKAIAELHAQHLRQATPVQRIVDRSVKLVGRPQFVAILTFIVLVWICANVGLGRHAFDRPPFQTLQDVGELVGLYITILILITQRRENELAELREQLTLELAILCEQKNAKIIQLLEELRRDNPLAQMTTRPSSSGAAFAHGRAPTAAAGAHPVRHQRPLELYRARQYRCDWERLRRPENGHQRSSEICFGSSV